MYFSLVSQGALQGVSTTNKRARSGARVQRERVGQVRGSTRAREIFLCFELFWSAYKDSLNIQLFKS